MPAEQGPLPESMAHCCASDQPQEMEKTLGTEASGREATCCTNSYCQSAAGAKGGQRAGDGQKWAAGGNE